MASLALSAYRHSRRNSDGPAAAYAAIDAALAGQELASRFVTALIAELDLATGALRWVSAGHPAPLLLRGGRLVKGLDVAPAPPLAPARRRPSGRGARIAEPGDMVLLYTDGLTEARGPGGELFSVERLGEFIEREAASGRPAPETLRQWREAIIASRSGSRRPRDRARLRSSPVARGAITVPDVGSDPTPQRQIPRLLGISAVSECGKSSTQRPTYFGLSIRCR